MKRMTEQGGYPDELGMIESALDRLGACEQAGADAGFESRLLDAAMAARTAREVGARPLPFAPGGSGLRLASEPHREAGALPLPFTPSRAIRSASPWQWRAAASVALSAGVLLGLTWLASRPAPPPFAVARAGASDADEIAAELERLLSEDAGWDAGLRAAILEVEHAVQSTVENDGEFWGTGGVDDPFIVEDTL